MTTSPTPPLRPRHFGFLLLEHYSMIAFANALWAGFELVEREQIEPNHFRSRIKLLNNNTLNNLLSALIPHVEIRSVREIIPSMNDIFIEVVQTQNKNNG